ncbi:MAG: hypothetical protein ACK4RV_02270 [Caulobacter sp.]
MLTQIKRLSARKRAYLATFGNGAVGHPSAVLADLKRFCRVPEAPVMTDREGRADPLQTGRMIGRQEVFNRIRAMIDLDERILLNLSEDEE